MIETYAFGDDKTLVTIDSENLDNYSSLDETYHIDSEVMTYALDKNERAHTEYNSETDTFVVIFNVLNQVKDNNHYETVPITFIIHKDQLITIYNKTNNYIVTKIIAYVQKNTHVSIYKLLFVSLFIISESYFPYIENMERSKDKINHDLRKKTTKKNLLALADIETGMVYLVSAANQNNTLLEQLKGQLIYKSFDDVVREQLDDSIIEARQVLSMTQLNAQVLQQMSNTYNNILNNNLNDTMTNLTIISILLAMLAVITGFFGMNVPLPFTDNKNAWILIIGFSFLIWFIYAIILRIIVRNK